MTTLFAGTKTGTCDPPGPILKPPLVQSEVDRAPAALCHQRNSMQLVLDQRWFKVLRVLGIR